MYSGFIRSIRALGKHVVTVLRLQSEVGICTLRSERAREMAEASNPSPKRSRHQRYILEAFLQQHLLRAWVVFSHHLYSQDPSSAVSGAGFCQSSRAQSGSGDE